MADQPINVSVKGRPTKRMLEQRLTRVVGQTNVRLILDEHPNILQDVDQQSHVSDNGAEAYPEEEISDSDDDVSIEYRFERRGNSDSDEEVDDREDDDWATMEERVAFLRACAGRITQLILEVNLDWDKAICQQPHMFFSTIKLIKVASPARPIRSLASFVHAPALQQIVLQRIRPKRRVTTLLEQVRRVARSTAPLKQLILNHSECDEQGSELVSDVMFDSPLVEVKVVETRLVNDGFLRGLPTRIPNHTLRKLGVDCRGLTGRTILALVEHIQRRCSAVEGLTLTSCLDLTRPEEFNEVIRIVPTIERFRISVHRPLGPTCLPNLLGVAGHLTKLKCLMPGLVTNESIGQVIRYLQAAPHLESLNLDMVLVTDKTALNTLHRAAVRHPRLRHIGTFRNMEITRFFKAGLALKHSDYMGPNPYLQQGRLMTTLLSARYNQRVGGASPARLLPNDLIHRVQTTLFERPLSQQDTYQTQPNMYEDGILDDPDDELIDHDMWDVPQEVDQYLYGIRPLLPNQQPVAGEEEEDDMVGDYTAYLDALDINE
jgi:hypothetical protein